jgi:hypothetical protein
MNPQLTEINAENKRPPAADVTDIEVRDKVNEAFAQTASKYFQIFELNIGSHYPHHHSNF